MTHGIDTGFLIAAELVEHADHAWARQTLFDVLGNTDRLAIAPQVIAEFIHIVTDSRRFAQPRNFKTACDLAEQWWTAADVERVFPNDSAARQFLKWIQQHQLGRKQLLDTLLARNLQRSWRAVTLDNQSGGLCGVWRFLGHIAIDGLT